MLTLTLENALENANTRAHRLHTLQLASWKQGQSGCVVRKRKGGVGVGPDAGFGVDLCIRCLTLGLGQWRYTD